MEKLAAIKEKFSIKKTLLAIFAIEIYFVQKFFRKRAKENAEEKAANQL